MHLASCGIINTCVYSLQAQKRVPSPPSGRCNSDSVLHIGKNSAIITNKCPTPEILVSSTHILNESEIASDSTSLVPGMSQLSAPLTESRIRKLSHSSDEVDSRDSRHSDGSNVQRASSTSDLGPQLHMPTSHSDGKIITGTCDSSNKITHNEISTLVSPLTNFNKDTMLAPFSVLAKGVQSLAPGAGKFARGMQNISVNFDPRRLKSQRQKTFEENAELKQKIDNCLSQFILL